MGGGCRYERSTGFVGRTNVGLAVRMSLVRQFCQYRKSSCKLQFAVPGTPAVSGLRDRKS